MTVLFVCRNFCSRALASYQRLVDKGFRVVVGYTKANSHLFYADEIHRWDGTQEALTEMIKSVNPRIVHVHNTPDHPTLWSRMCFAGPICHDVHDFSQDPGFLNVAGRVADYVYCVNEDMSDHFSDRIKGEVETYYTCPVRDRSQLPKLSDDGEVHIGFIGGFHHEYNCLQDGKWLSDRFSDLKVHLHVHSQNFRDKLEKFETNYFHLEDVIDFMDIPTQLSRYDAGMCLPFDGKKEHLVYNYTYMFPSKLFDYLQSGLPVICDWRYVTMSRYLQEHGLGVPYRHLVRGVIEKAKGMKIGDYPVKTILECEPYRSLID